SARAVEISRAELSDLAAELSRRLVATPKAAAAGRAAIAPAEAPAVRAAVVASSPAELASRLAVLHASLAAGGAERLDSQAGVFHSHRKGAPRIGWLFPGQGSPAYRDGGLIRRRFAEVRELYARADLPQSSDGVATEVAQPAIVAASLAALRILERLGI